MSIDSHTRVRPIDRPEITHQTKRAKLRFEVDKIRLERAISRCQCGHGVGVHVDTGCAMDDCDCVTYQT